MTKAQLYLLRADLLLCKERRMCVAERVKTEIRGEIQPSLVVDEELRHRR